MRTGCFVRLKELAPDEYPVAISRGVPKWYDGRRELASAPTWKMLKMVNEEYEECMTRQLELLDPLEMAESLGEHAVLLCWEVPFKLCHRRRIAEWLEQATGLVIPEVGFSREETMSYADMHLKIKPTPYRTLPML